MHFRYAMPDVLIFLKLLRFALLEQFLDDACSIALPRYIMLTILSENWLLHFQKLESTFPMSKFCWWKRLNMQNFILFCWLHKMTSWIFWALKNMLNTVKGLWLRENGRKKMIVCRHTWYSELVGVTSIFFWPGHNYTRERGGHPRYLSSAQETSGLSLISGIHTGSSFKICRL